MPAKDGNPKTHDSQSTETGIAPVLDAAFRAQDWPQVKALLVHGSLSLVHAPRGLQRMRLALEEMPETFRDEQSDLRFHLEFVGLAPIANLDSEDVEELFAGARQPRTGLLQRFTLAILARRLAGRVTEALEIADRTEAKAIDEASRIGSPAEGAASAYFAQAAKTFLLAGRHEKALRYYLNAWKWRHQDDLGFVAHEAASGIALVHALSTRIEDGEEWLAFSKSWPSSISPEYSSVVEFAVPLTEFIIATEKLDLARAKEILARLPLRTHGFEFYPLVAEARIKFLLVSGETRQAQSLLDEASDVLEEDHLRRLQTEILIQSSCIEAATKQVAMIHDGGPAHLFRARIAALNGDYQVALNELEAGFTQSAPRAQLDFIALRASCHLALGQRALAKATFEKLLKHLNGCLSVLTSVSAGSVQALFDLVPTSHTAEALREQWTARGAYPRYNFPRAQASQQTSLDLTPRELAVLQQLLQGHSRKQVASRESVSLNTIKTQSRSAFRKLGVSSIQEARTRSIELGYL